MKRILIPLCLVVGSHVASGQRSYQFEAPDRLFVEGKELFSLKNYPGCIDKLEAYKQHAKDADLFICEGMYGEKEKAAKAREYKHMTFYEAANLAKEAQPSQMWLTHYSPSLTRPEEYMEEAKQIFPRAKAARDGWTVELEFDEE